MSAQDLLLITVGNTRTKWAATVDGKLQPPRSAINTDAEGLAAALVEAASALTPGGRIVVASVNEPVADPLAQRLARSPAGSRVIRLSRPADIPIEHDLPAPLTVGVDRLLNALGAFARSGEACVVVDAGTAITVDLVDGQGVFRGGVIAPGLGLMMRALHEHTAALPLIAPPKADPGEPFGKTTPEAITLGCLAAARGLARGQVDRFAEWLGRYPRVIATGGDAPLLFEHDEVVEHIVPELTLIGMLTATQGVGPVGG